MLSTSVQNRTFSIIVPTRNRGDLLISLIQQINLEDKSLTEIIIIDSSDLPLNVNVHFNNVKVRYFHTTVKSASIQRNMGIKELNQSTKYVFFLDDDVIPSRDYFHGLINNLITYEAVGASGVALKLNVSKIKRSFLQPVITSVKRIFLLDSKFDGKLLRSGVNIPVRNQKNLKKHVQEVDWLIGCSAWDKSIFTKIEFAGNFYGQSLGEDVLFSASARQFGKLIVDPNIILTHLESPIMRPDILNYYKMWIRNRYIISTELKLSRYNLLFHWCNVGKILNTLILIPLNRTQNLRALKGILLGYLTIMRNNVN